MKTPISSPLTSTPVSSSANGDSHDSSGSSEPSGAVPPITFASATTANTSSATTWAKIITFCTRADSSMPSTHTSVMTAMITTAIAVTAAFDSAAESQPTSSSP